MAKNDWGDDAVAVENPADWGDRLAAQQDLPEGMKPSKAGGGRGLMVPPPASQPAAPASFQPDTNAAEYGDVAQGLQNAPAEQPVSVLQTQGMPMPDPQRRLILGAGPINQQTASRAEQMVDGQDPGMENRPVVERAAAGLKQQVDAGQRRTFGQKADMATEPERLEKTGDQMRMDRRREFAEENPVLGGMASGAAGLLSGTINTPQLAADAFNKTFVDPVLRTLGFDAMPSPGTMPGTEALSEIAASYAPIVGQQPMAEAWEKDEFGPWLVANLAQQSPQIAQSITAAFVPPLRAIILPGMGAQAAGMSYVDGDDSRIAVAKGLVEIGTEMLPLKAFDKIGEALSALPANAQRSILAKAGQKLMASGGAITANMMTNAIEEGLAEFGGNVLDKYVAGKDVNLTESLPDAMVLGAAAGGAMGAPQAAVRLSRDDSPQAQAARELSRELDGTTLRGDLVPSGLNPNLARPVDRTEQIKGLRANGDTTAADMLKRRFDREMATYNAGSESQKLATFGPQVQERYQAIRMAGAQPGDAVVKTAIQTGFEQAAEMAGLSTKARAALEAKLEGMPPDKAPAVVQKYITALANAGAAQPFVGLDTLATDMDERMNAMLDSVIAGDILPTMTAIQELEQANEADQAATTEADTAGTGPLEVADDVASGEQAALDSLSEAVADPDAEWATFEPATGTLAVPRAEMPQIKAQHRGAMVNFLKGRNVTSEQGEVDPGTLKPTQAEFSARKVEQATTFDGPDRSILVSSDNHVVDGHHQWLAKMATGQPVKVIRLNAPIAELLPMVREFPSSTVDASNNVQNPTQGTAGTQPQAAPVEARAPEGGDAAAAAGVPAEGGGRSEQADGVATASWVIRNNATGEVIMETFDQKKVDALNTTKYEAVPVQQHLGQVNRVIKEYGEEAANRWMRGEGLPATTTSQPEMLGRNSVPIAEGGKPFKTQKAAREALKQQTGMRVVKADGGFVLAPKSPAQIAAQQNAAKKLGGVGNAGVPMAAHELMASRGGLNKSTMSDLGFDRNQRVGAKWLFAANGGLTMEQATEALQQSGYMEGTDQGKAIAMIHRSARGNPVYTPDGYEQMARAETEAQFADYLDAQTDPLDSLAADGYTDDDMAGTGFEQADPEIQAEVAALSAQMEAIGRDPVDIMERLALQYPDDTQKEFHERAKAALTQAVAEAAQPAGRGDSGQDGSEPGQAREGSSESLTDRPDGTLAVKGDTKALRERLTAAGIPARSILPSASGVVVGKTQAKAAREALQPVLTTPTRSDVEAQQDRAEQADKLDQRAQVKRESEAGAGTFELSREDGRKDDTGVLFTVDGQSSQPDTPPDGNTRFTITDAQRQTVGRVQASIRKRTGNGAYVLEPVELVSGREFIFATDLAREGFGLKITPVRQTGKKVFNGAQVGNDLLMDVNTSRPAMVVMGHELLHKLRRDDPVLYSFLKVQIESVLNDGAASGYAKTMRERYAKLDLEALSDDVAFEEMLADIVGDQFGQRKFWDLLATKNQGRMLQLARKVMEFFDRVLGLGRSEFPFGTDRYLKDVTKAREIVADVIAEYSADRTRADSSGRVESDSRLSVAERQDQTDTPAFKRWFGDWKDPNAFSSKRDSDKPPVSMAVENSGKPMTLYHATNADFNTFDVARTTTNSTTFGDVDTERYGIFATQDQTFAEEYFRGKDGSNVMPVYMNVKSPVDLTEGLMGDVITDIVENSSLNRNDFYNLPTTDMWQLFDGNFGRQVVEALRKAGYDGAIMKELSRDREREVDVWVAFEPTQLKSATGNTGNFDPENPDIRFMALSAGRGTNRAMPENQAPGPQGDAQQGANKGNAVAVARQIAQAINDDGDSTAVYGLRVIPGDFKGAVSPGDALPPSNQWDDGQDTGEALEGTSAVLIDGTDEKAAERAIRLTGAHGKPGSNGYYYGDQVVLVKGDRIRSGEDAGEVLIRDAVAVSAWRKPTKGNSEVIPNDQSAPDTSGANPDIRFSIAGPAAKAPTPSPVTAAPATPAQLPLLAPQANPPSRAPVPEETRSRATQRVNQDQFNRFTVIRNWAKEQGMSLTQISDVWGFEERMHGRIATRVEDFREKRVQPLIQRIQKAGFTMPQVAEFLHAQHAEERNKQILSIDPTNLAGSGMDTADAKVILAAAKPELVKLANEFRNIADDTKSLLLTGGIISQEMVDAWEKTYKNYVPLKGGDQDTPPIGTGKGLSVKATNKRALGHSERSEFIIENMLRDHERAVMLVEKNRVGHSLLAMTVELGREDIATFGQPERRKVLKNQVSFEVVGRNGSVVGTFDTQNSANLFIVSQKRAGLTVRQVKGDPVVSYMASPMLAENEVQVYVKGQTVRIQLNDPLLAQQYKKLGVERLGRVMQANRAINGMLSKVYTAYNPEFFIKNVLRDFTSGLINITGQEGALIAAKSAAAYPRAFGQMLRYSFGKNPGPLIKAMDFATGGWFLKNAMSQSIKLYREHGGTTGAAYLSDIERVGADIQAAYEEYQGAIKLAQQGKPGKAVAVAGKKLVRLLIGFMEHLNAAGENAMRLAVFDAVRNEPGRTIQEAASLAKNSTVNFNRRGEIGAQAGALYLFFNPAMQGTAATLDALMMAKHKHQAQVVAGAMVALALSLAALQFGGDDEEDREAWEKIPDHVKDRNLVIRTGEDAYITLAVPYGYGFFFTLGNAIFELMRGADKDKIALKLASGLVEHFGPAINPISGDDLDPKGMVELVPGLVGGELMRAGARAVVNRSGLGGEIVPESPFDEGKPDNLKMYRSSKGTAYESAANMMNQITGGTKSQPGMIDVSPETLKFWTQTVTGGAGKFVMDFVNTATLMSAKLGENDPEAINALTPDIRETPLIRTVVRKQDIRDTRRVYWEKVKEAEKAIENYARAKKMEDDEGELRVDQQKSHLLDMGRMIKDQNEAIKAERDTIELINLSDKYTRAEKRMMIKDIERGEEELYNEMIRIFNMEKPR